MNQYLEKIKAILPGLGTDADSGLKDVVTEYIQAEIVAASRNESNWTWDEGESSCGGADVTDPKAEAGSMWCGSLSVESLGMTIPYAFGVRWDGKKSVDIEFDSGCRDGDVGDVEVDDNIVYLLDMTDLIDVQDICWNAGPEGPSIGDKATVAYLNERLAEAFALAAKLAAL